MDTALVVQSMSLALLLGMVSASPLLVESKFGARMQDLFHPKETSTQFGIDPEVFMDATELITSKGYPCENHYVTTEDGYILNVLRIPHGLNNSAEAAADRPVVVLQHGLLGSATNWLANPANESLGFILADAGADVWLGNSRGNTYSVNHTTLNPKDKEFWDFSWDEMAKYDLPALIKYVVSKSGAQQVYYAGHSQGTTMAFARLSEDQELASYIKHFLALAPVAHMGHAKTPLSKIAPLVKNNNKLFYDMFGHRHALLTPEIIRYLQGELCARASTICENIFFILCGFDKPSLNMTRMQVYDAHVPAGTSSKDILHWAQAINSKQFQKFDYGSAQENMKHYNQSTPPLYDPSKVKVPVAFFRGGNDWLAATEDVNWLLPQLDITKDVFIKRYEHLDFIWAFDAPSLVYDDVLKIVFAK